MFPQAVEEAQFMMLEVVGGDPHDGSAIERKHRQNAHDRKSAAFFL
jgi:hypothetical protein